MIWVEAEPHRFTVHDHLRKGRGPAGAEQREGEAEPGHRQRDSAVGGVGVAQDEAYDGFGKAHRADAAIRHRRERSGSPADALRIGANAQIAQTSQGNTITIFA